MRAEALTSAKEQYPFTIDKLFSFVLFYLTSRAFMAVELIPAV